mmetsp:Transcript_136564/g.237040  ORF Transcript_136564/g.237040 Transcript_136564/m.237040 type:complete len:268 (-) Transcript_136564:1773-2576(-)
MSAYVTVWAAWARASIFWMESFAISFDFSRRWPTVLTCCGGCFDGASVWTVPPYSGKADPAGAMAKPSSPRTVGAPVGSRKGSGGGFRRSSSSMASSRRRSAAAASASSRARRSSASRCACSKARIGPRTLQYFRHCSWMRWAAFSSRSTSKGRHALRSFCFNAISNWPRSFSMTIRSRACFLLRMSWRIQCCSFRIFGGMPATSSSPCLIFKARSCHLCIIFTRHRESSLGRGKYGFQVPDAAVDMVMDMDMAGYELARCWGCIDR